MVVFDVGEGGEVDWEGQGLMDLLIVLLEPMVEFLAFDDVSLVKSFMHNTSITFLEGIILGDPFDRVES